jgi:hypothetical protein
MPCIETETRVFKRKDREILFIDKTLHTYCEKYNECSIFFMETPLNAITTTIQSLIFSTPDKPLD